MSVNFDTLIAYLRLDPRDWFYRSGAWYYLASDLTEVGPFPSEIEAMHALRECRAAAAFGKQHDN